jgi:uncharacterized lipoprotein
VNKSFVALSLGLMSALAAGCSSWGGSCHDPKAYMAATEAVPLKVPTDKQAVDTTQSLKIPPLNEPAPPPRQQDDACLDAPPAYVIPKPQA